MQRTCFCYKFNLKSFVYSTGQFVFSLVMLNTHSVQPCQEDVHSETVAAVFDEHNINYPVFVDDKHLLVSLSDSGS